MLFSELLGTEIILKNSKKKLGTLIDLEIFNNSSEVSNLIFSLNKLFPKDSFYTSLTNKKILKDTIILDDNKCIFTYRNANNRCTRLSTLLNKRVVSANGEEKGILSDMILADDISEIKYLLISDGIYNDFLQGKSKCPLTHPFAAPLDTDYVMIANECLEEIKTE